MKTLETFFLPSSYFIPYFPFSVMKIGFTEDSYVFTEGDGNVSVCATILTPLDQLAAPSALIVFAIYTIEGTAHSKLA